MADVKQAGTGKTPATNPMNLTCQPVKITRDGAAATKYAVVINKDGNAQPPNTTWTKLFVSTETYHLTNDDGTFAFDIPSGGLGIYEKAQK